MRLSAGSVEDLAEPLARHGVQTPPAAPGGPPDGADPEVAALLRSGWDPVLALRIARRPAPPDTVADHERPAARALLDPWLGLAGSTAGAGLRSRLLRCALRLCPGPWSVEEVTVLARHAGTVTDAFDAAAGGERRTGFPGPQPRERRPGGPGS